MLDNRYIYNKISTTQWGVKHICQDKGVRLSKRARRFFIYVRSNFILRYSYEMERTDILR